MACDAKKAEHELTRYNNEEIRIVMVGKTGVGKSAMGNTILGTQYFKSEFSPKSSTTVCKKASGEVNGQKVSVIDTPGLFDTRIDEEKTKKDIVKSISYASPGPHILLVIIRLGRFTEEEKKTLHKIQEIFGEEADKYSMVLFTHGDLLKGKPIEEFLKDSEELQELVDKCNGQYHVLNNVLKDRSQVSELLDKMRYITEKNGGSHYSTEMYQRAERAMEEKKIRETKKTVASPVSLLGLPHLQISFPGCQAPKISLLGPFPFRYHLCQYNRPLMVGGCIVFSFRGQYRQMRRSMFMKYHIITNAINYKNIMEKSPS
ncbi:GTPase IMAP family member 9-like [Sander lucioperca]|uniref:GTPase IMAP family member 9-like n=1 Tax=Sander lucioperca TaxID=283035 RepID=UPI001653A0E3|nr:GTPase IMAP family member 9-like [Sander lucioperca]